MSQPFCMHDLCKVAEKARVWHAAQALATQGEVRVHHDRTVLYYAGVVRGLELAGASWARGTTAPDELAKIAEHLGLSASRWASIQAFRPIG